MIGRGRRPVARATSVLIFTILAGFAFQLWSGALANPVILANNGAIVPAYIFEHGQYWRLATAMFLHGGGLHLVLNLIALYQLGRLYELMFGTPRFVSIYFVTGIIASLTSALRLPPWGASVGASGAIFGILGAFVFSVRRSPLWRHDRVAKSLVGQCVFWIVANTAIGFTIPQIDTAAHMGGLVAGLILGAVLPHRVPPPPPAQSVIDVQPSES